MLYTDRGSQVCKAAEFFRAKEEAQKSNWGRFEETLVKHLDGEVFLTKEPEESGAIEDLLNT